MKNGIASSCLLAALQNSCPHQMQESFLKQVSRLVEAGFAPNFIACIAERLLMNIRTTESSRNKSSRPSRPAVIPYIHRVSHSLKMVASIFQIPVVFSAPCKLSQLCGRVSRAGTKKLACGKRHVNNFGPCAVGVVYQISLSCTENGS